MRTSAAFPGQNVRGTKNVQPELQLTLMSFVFFLQQLKSVPPTEAQKLMKRGWVLLDVRPDDVYEQVGTCGRRVDVAVVRC